MRIRVSAPVPPGELVGDVLLVLGLAAVAVGVGLWSVPLMLVVVGVVLFVLGLGLSTSVGTRRSKPIPNASGPFEAGS